MHSKNKLAKKIYRILENVHISIIEYVLFKIIGYKSQLDPSTIYAAYVEYIISNNREAFPKILFRFIKKMIEEHKDIKHKKMSIIKKIATYIYSIFLSYGLKISKRKVIKFVNIMCNK